MSPIRARFVGAPWLATSVTVLLAAPSPGAAVTGADRVPEVAGRAVCDTALGEWFITWSVTNPHSMAGTLGNIRVAPVGHPLVGMPNRVLPGQTATGGQQAPPDGYTASITFDVNWDDGAVTYDVYWPIYIRIGCPAS
ncbi:hypothetical protein EV385_5143 [Krasilnikovia cinnamomea]|uniref:Uncharacterized protein n=1 Tax=Krasilnikovia cinnamomea TaxID=349313 RepID=A0A4Q7ZQ65_9ACTN|nr:hypothetical protein [Krasilnikovia cinnamomea]RZU53240.1 hypothetical protein EV385_5143 [Krasilnikovia cinnamomea]